MNIRCLLFGHKVVKLFKPIAVEEISDYRNKGYDIQMNQRFHYFAEGYECKTCKEFHGSKYGFEDGLFMQIWHSKLLKGIMNFCVSLLLLALIVTILSLIILSTSYPFYANSCYHTGQQMGLPSHYDFWSATCFVKYHEYWIPSKQIIQYLGGLNVN